MTDPTNTNDTPSTPETSSTPETLDFDVSAWRADMLTATAAVCDTLHRSKHLDETDYPNVFKAATMLLDPSYDGRPTIVRTFDNIAQGLAQNPQTLIALAKLVAPIFGGRVETSGTRGRIEQIPMEPIRDFEYGKGIQGKPISGNAVAWMCLCINRSTGAARVDIFSEAMPTSVNEDFVSVLHADAPTFEEARKIVLDLADDLYPGLAARYRIGYERESQE